MWSGRLSVGDFRSWGCCPKTIIYTKQKAKNFPESLLFKFELGHAIHAAYQQRAMDTPNLKWIKPYNIPNVKVKTRNEWGQEIEQTFKEKLDAAWGEIPVCVRNVDGQIVIMGYVDDVENMYGKPVVVDIKSINCPALDFRLRFDETTERTIEGYFIQTQFYALMMNRDEYYSPFTIEKTKLLYVCTSLLGDPDGEREVVRPILDEHQTKFESIIKESIEQVYAYDNNKDIKCGYHWCSTHN